MVDLSSGRKTYFVWGRDEKMGSILNFVGLEKGGERERERERERKVERRKKERERKMEI